MGSENPSLTAGNGFSLAENGELRLNMIYQKLGGHLRSAQAYKSSQLYS